MDETRFTNARLFRRLKALEQLDELGQQALIRILDVFITQQRVASAVTPVD